MTWGKGNSFLWNRSWKLKSPQRWVGGFWCKKLATKNSWRNSSKSLAWLLMRGGVTIIAFYVLSSDISFCFLCLFILSLPRTPCTSCTLIPSALTLILLVPYEFHRSTLFTSDFPILNHYEFYQIPLHIWILNIIKYWLGSFLHWPICLSKWGVKERVHFPPL